MEVIFENSECYIYYDERIGAYVIYTPVFITPYPPS
jgi:hypothetical protein